jgi:Na+-transporting methylmalonyl-CoA/oxaloacetate decarboxylase gamma subunit
MDFFEIFRDKETIHTLAMNQKIIASLMVTAIGMGVTFVGLITIQYMIQLTSIIIRGIEGTINKPVTIDKSPATEPETVQVIPQGLNGAGSEEITEELIAIITAAIAASLETTTSSIVVKNIRRVGKTEPAWSVAGRSEQLDSRF